MEATAKLANIAKVAHSTAPPPVNPERARYLQRIANTPANAATSGVYVVGLHRALRKAGVAAANPDAFKSLHYYSLRDFMSFMVDSAGTLHATASLHEGLRRLGLMVIPNFAESLGGKMLMSLGECSWEMALSCVTRGYQLSLRPGRARVISSSKGSADIELRDIWSFGESYQVGVIQGLMTWYRINGTVEPEVLSPCDTLLHLTWHNQ